MRPSALLVLMPLLLAGCTGSEFSFGSGAAVATSDSDRRVEPLEVVAVANEAARAWNPRAILLMASGEAAEESANFFGAPKPKHPLFADGRMQIWKFSYVVPGSVAMFAVDVDADGDVVGDRKLDLSSFSPDTSGYREYFAMTPIDPAWMNMTRVLDALRANDTVNPFVGGRASAVQYALVPDPRDLYAWRVTIKNDAGLLKAELDPATWELYSVSVDGSDGSLVRYEVRGFSTLPSGLEIERVWGEREDGASNLSRVGLYVAHAGAPVDLRALALVVARGEDERRLAWDAEAGYDARWLRGGRDDGVLRAGDLVSLTFALDEPLPPRSEFSVTLVPPQGTPVARDVRTPASYGSGQSVDLG